MNKQDKVTAYDRVQTARAGKRPMGRFYINKMIDYIQKRYIDPQLKSNTFSISHVSPRYRKWISPMFEINNLSDLLNANRILVVDETFTTGSSTNQIVSLLRAAGYNKDIDIFTLLNNR